MDDFIKGGESLKTNFVIFLYDIAYMVRNDQNEYPYLNLSQNHCLQQIPDTLLYLVIISSQ